MGFRRQGFWLEVLGRGRSIGRQGTRDEAAVRGRPDRTRSETVNIVVVSSSI